MDRPATHQLAADVIAAQAGRIAALIEAVEALIETHPDRDAFRAKLVEAVARSPVRGGEEGAEPLLRGHREVTNYLAELSGRSPQ
jgi:DNA-binding SARP family transcriptional activator